MAATSMTKRTDRAARKRLDRKRKKAAAWAAKLRQASRPRTMRPPPLLPDGPHVIITRDKKRRIAFEFSSASGIADRLGRATFLAFMKCFAGADRLLGLQDLYRKGVMPMPKRSVAFWRNWRLVTFATIGMAHELGD